MRDPNVLITAASRRVPLIRAFRSALRRERPDGRVVAVDLNPLSPGLYSADLRALVPPVRHPEYVPQLLARCAELDVGLVVPTIDEELPVLAAAADRFAHAGVVLLLSSAATVERCNDKLQAARFAHASGLPWARTWAPDEARSRSDFPMFLKPRLGRGSVGAHEIRDRRALEFFLDYVPDPIVQEYLHAPEYTIDVLFDLHGRPLHAVPRRRLLVRSGVSDRGVTVDRPDLVDLGVRIGVALGIRGPANVQCRDDGDGRPRVFEVNARFSGGIPLTIAAGADFPRECLRAVAGRPPLGRPGRYRSGLTMINYCESMFRDGLPEVTHEDVLEAPAYGGAPAAGPDERVAIAEIDTLVESPPSR